MATVGDNDDLEMLLALGSQLDAEPRQQAVAKGLTTLLLEQASTEREAPEILPYPEPLINSAFATLLRQEEMVRTLSKQSPAQSTMLPFRAHDLIALEARRIKYALSDLIRVRTRKIDCFALTIEHNAETYSASGLLSAKEEELARQLAALQRTTLVERALKGLPDALQSLGPSAEEEGILVQPESDAFVIAYALRNVGLRLPARQEELQLGAGDVFMAPFAALRRYVQNGDLCLA